MKQGMNSMAGAGPSPKKGMSPMAGSPEAPPAGIAPTGPSTTDKLIGAGKMMQSGKESDLPSLPEYDNSHSQRYLDQMLQELMNK